MKVKIKGTNKYISTGMPLTMDLIIDGTPCKFKSKCFTEDAAKNLISVGILEEGSDNTQNTPKKHKDFTEQDTYKLLELLARSISIRINIETEAVLEMFVLLSRLDNDELFRILFKESSILNNVGVDIVDDSTVYALDYTTGTIVSTVLKNLGKAQNSVGFFLTFKDAEFAKHCTEQVCRLIRK